VAVLVVGLIVTGVLTWASRAAYVNNEKRLLRLRGKEIGSVLSEALPTIQTPLASAAALAVATNGDARKVRQFIATYVGSPPRPFITASLWRIGAIGKGPLTTVGVAPMLRTPGASAQAFFARAEHARGLALIGMLSSPTPRLGYALVSRSTRGGYAMYAEAALPPSRRSPIQRNQAFSDLNYALYLGRSQRPADLLLTSEKVLPIRGRHATDVISFGDSALTLVTAPRSSLSGGLSQDLPWIILAAGVLLSLVSAAVTVVLTGRRRAAERLADRLERVAAENRRLYAEQRNIAQTLQHALLPYELPQMAGAVADARFEPGERGVEIGGDWYDLIVLGDRRLLLVVGDVSGRGVRAAATMASLRFAIHAYAAEGDTPSSILTKLSSLVSIGAGGRLATVLCALIDIGARSLTLTSAGHLPPLLIVDGGGEFVDSPVGLPVGVDPAARYESTTISVPPGATLLAYTDGLIERRGENLDQGLARLRTAAGGADNGLPELLTRLLHDMRDGPSEDDTAIVGLRWTE
jgi:serine phosphatase RsbU (regulator of sigma subunit)